MELTKKVVRFRYIKKSSPVTQEVGVTSPNLNVQDDLASPDATIDRIHKKPRNVNSNVLRDRGVQIGVRPMEVFFLFLKTHKKTQSENRIRECRMSGLLPIPQALCLTPV